MNETIKTLTERRSCKQYKSGHIPKEDIELIVAAGINAPSGMNRQTPRFIIVQNDETVKKLSKMNAAVMGRDDIDPFYGASDVIVVVAKKEGTYIYDGSLAMGNLLNAAYSLGCGCRWIHRAKEVFESEEGRALLAEWGVEDDVEGIGFCILGYPDAELALSEKKGGRIFWAE